MTAAPAHEPLPDLRRLMAFRAHGAVRLLLKCRAALEDIEGAVSAGQPEVAVLMAYDLVQLSLSVRGLRTVGELSCAAEQPTFDPFAGVPAMEVEDGLRLAAAGAEAVGSADGGAAWLDRLRDHLAATERRLGYSAPLPEVRTGKGLMKGFKLARDWSSHMRRLGLPDVMPSRWTQRDD
ncbi:hypothetical protein SAMN05421505_10120 [Sinosporangium album]|uniref:Uncharacterized protein n=1 Tax=Sinosporangium album TaxID=504805 RepID=A0A1G7QK57_9ACTN|nr:hypothetical protein [Sinosporangium album]SDF98872.1 hypothetical protein SAMN05421505_10120 [Sinosporangium album]